jgi:hypothetical protein
MTKWTLFSIMWGVAGSMTLFNRAKFSKKIVSFTPVDLPSVLNDEISLIDYEVRIEDVKYNIVFFKIIEFNFFLI